MARVHMSIVLMVVLAAASVQCGQAPAEFVKAYVTEWNRNIVPDYPGLTAFQELEELLEERVDTHAIEANTAYLEELSNKLPHRAVKPMALINAVNLVLALKFVVDEQKCSNVTSRAATLNINALESAKRAIEAEARGEIAPPVKGKPREEQPPTKPLVRLELVINHYFGKIVAICDRQVEQNLERAIGLVENQGYNKLTTFLSEYFIDKWSEKTGVSVTISPEQMGSLLNWSRRPLEQVELPQLMLRQLFKATPVHPQPLDGRELYYSLRNGDKWPKIVGQQVFRGVLHEALTKPCMSYLKQVDAHVFKLFYLAASVKLPGVNNQTTKVLSGKGRPFLYNQFRYEFCHFEAPILGHQLWRAYILATTNVDVLEKRVKRSR